MATTTVLLREDIETLGGRGEIVKVKAGYARNYLLPQGLASLATKGNIKQIENEREALLKKAAQEKSTAEAQASQMGDISLTFTRKVGETGHLFGSVTSMDITEALKEKGYEIDRRQVNLKDVIKETGEFTVPVKLHREVTIDVPVKVTDEEGNIIETEEAKQEKADKAARAEADKAEAAKIAEAEAAAETEESTEDSDEDAEETTEE
jgi:large subunit ribosomal protein L9